MEHKSALDPWPTVSEEDARHYAIFDLVHAVRRSPTTRREHRFLVLRAPDWVNVIALTPQGETVLVEQYRHGTERLTLEIPGGAVDPGEPPRAAAAILRTCRRSRPLL